MTKREHHNNSSLSAAAQKGRPPTITKNSLVGSTDRSRAAIHWYEAIHVEGVLERYSEQGEILFDNNMVFRRIPHVYEIASYGLSLATDANETGLQVQRKY